MKHAILITTLAALTLTGGALAAYESDAGKGQHGPRIDFEEVDANGDGQLTRDEMEAHHAARYDGADSDGNGKLSAAELKARMQARMNERIDRRIGMMITRHDADGDGMLSPEEMQPRHMGRMFMRVDADGDGAISREEFETMQQMRGKHRMGQGMSDDG